MPNITSYQDADNWIMEGRNANSRTVAGNTIAQRMPFGEISIVFYATRIITYYRDGRIILNSGGFRTVTTKSRMNEFSPAQIMVYQREFTWYVTFSDGAKDRSFVDGMNVGKPSNFVLGSMRNIELAL